MSSIADLSNIFLSRDIEYFFSFFSIPFAHLECKGGLSDSWLTREEYEWSWSESTIKNSVKFLAEAWYLVFGSLTWSLYFLNILNSSFLDSSLLLWFIRGFYETIPCSTVQTLSWPFWECDMTVRANKHNNNWSLEIEEQNFSDFFLSLYTYFTLFLKFYASTSISLCYSLDSSLSTIIFILVLLFQANIQSSYRDQFIISILRRTPRNHLK